jgi:hypothetical protein
MRFTWRGVPTRYYFFILTVFLRIINYIWKTRRPADGAVVCAVDGAAAVGAGARGDIKFLEKCFDAYSSLPDDSLQGSSIKYFMIRYH